jgi:hypothetical protein
MRLTTETLLDYFGERVLRLGFVFFFFFFF